jgi:GGDEF domain-containing protein
MTGIEVPLELAAMLGAGCAAAGAWAGQLRASRQRKPQPSPLGALMNPETLVQAIDLTARRDALRAGANAVLHGRIDGFAHSAAAGQADARDEVRAHVAAVMRAGLRRGDRLTLVEDASEDRFTIVIPGVDERAAVRIADRLRRRLAQLRLPQIGGDVGLTARFGVAAGRRGETDDGRDARARRALDAAMARGADHVVPASQIEEVIMLPPPAATAASAA